MIKAIIFDLDGVIIDSEKAHVHGFKKVLEEYGIEFGKKEIDEFFGHGALNTIAILLKRNNIDPGMPINDLVLKKDEFYREYFSRNFKTIPGVKNFIANTDLRKCIASATSMENREFILERLGLDFEFMLTRQDVEKIKPEPDIYEKACEKLALSSNECVVIEDTAIGIRAAKRAGCKAIGITTTLKRDLLKEADLIINSYKELDDKKIEKLWIHGEKNGL